MAIYDCCMYFDEDLLLDLRMNILRDTADKFVIVEATRDHSGKEKTLKFDINKFKKFKDRIIYHIVEDIPEKVTSYKKGWSPDFYRENFHRNSIEKALTQCNPNDLILISDADEIPNPDIFKEIKIKKFALFAQNSYLYKFNLFLEKNWLGTGACYKKYLKSPQWLRNKRFLRRGFIRKIFFKTQIIQNGGWHFSFLKTPEEILKKMSSYAHSEFKESLDINYIQKKISDRKTFFSKDQKLTKVPIDANLPSYIRLNIDTYSDWII